MKNSWKWIVGINVGTVGGYAYWYFIGCASGSCAITSSPVNSSLYGAMLGGLLVSSFSKSTPRKNDGEKTNQEDYK